MPGQSDAADDLIAELAKLMAQDAQGEQKPRSTATESQFPSVRIPGDSTRPVSTDPTAGFVPAVVASAAKDSAPAGSDEPVVDPVTPKRQSTDNAPEPEPFHFDFDLMSGNRPQVERESASAANIASPQPEPAPQAEASSGRESDMHDTIADLISAELAAGSAQPAQQAPVEPVALAPRPISSPMPAAVPTEPAPRRDVGSQSPGPEHDRFRVPPVFGLGSTVPKPVAPTADTFAASAPVEPERGLAQPAAAPVVAPTPVADSAVELDPIDEIESLIGSAMRVEFDLPADEVNPPEPAPAAVAPKPAPSPALRTLATPTIAKSDANGMSAADQTIFAAAQATGAKVGWVNEPDLVDEDTETDHVAPRQRRGSGAGISRALAGPLVAVTLLLAAGFGLYWVLGLGGSEAGPAPLLSADTSPNKEAAPAASADSAAATQSVVFNEMDGVVPSANEQLVSRDQSDVNEVTQAASAATDLSEEGLANRKVRTVKVRPDGTIVSGDDSVAGSAILPVDRPNVPAVPGAETTAPELLANTDPVQPAVAEIAPAQTIVPVTPGSTVPAVDLTGKLIAGKSATIPLVRPAGLRIPDTTQAITDTPSAPAAAAAATPSLSIPGATEVPALGNSAPAYVQLASQRSEAEARQSAQNMVTRYGPLFGGANLEVQRVDLGAKGIYYRVRVPASSIEQANLICTNVKAAGGDCFTL